MDALTKCLNQSRAFATSAYDNALRMKQTGELGAQLVADGLGGLSNLQDQSKFKARYGLYRGWLYSAVNALAMQAAGQPANVARLANAEPSEGERGMPSGTKAWMLRRMPASLASKAVHREMEIIEDHPLLEVLEHPNPWQTRWQFVYSFVANLNLTGWAYIVKDEVKGRTRLYSLPTTWITPAGTEKEGLYSKYRIRNPKNPASQGEIIDAEFVAVARIPDPSNPMGALSPSTSQINAIRIDEHIQDSQEHFFENGAFPSVIVTVGKVPLKGQELRPRLTAPQRRQIISSINKRMTGVRNFGHPAIVDGLIERIDRLGMNQTEMGWDKSEDKTKQRILSAFAVNPFVLGEKAPGSYAMAKEVKQLFYDRVNTFLEMLGCAVNELIRKEPDSKGKLIVWWDKAEAIDPKIRADHMKEARKIGDITRDENRAELGFPPSEEEIADRSPLLDSVGGMTATGQLVAQLAQGALTKEQLAFLLNQFLQIPQEDIIIGLGAAEKPPEEIVPLLREAVAALKEPLKLDVTGIEKRADEICCGS